MYPPKTSSQQMIIVWWFYRPFIIDRIRLFIPIINVQQDLKKYPESHNASIVPTQGFKNQN